MALCTRFQMARSSMMGWNTKIYSSMRREVERRGQITWGEAAKAQRLPNFASDFEIGKHRMSISVHSEAQIHAHCNNVTINLLAMYFALISFH
jgi:hypothetical protein